MATHTWKIKDLETLAEDGFVSAVYWELTTVSPQGEAFSSGVVRLERPESLVSFNDLSEDLVIGWVKNQLAAWQTPAEDFENQNEEKILQNANKKDLPSGLPWVG